MFILIYSFTFDFLRKLHVCLLQTVFFLNLLENIPAIIFKLYFNLEIPASNPTNQKHQ